MRKNRRTSRGFTLGEVVLSVGVLVVGILPIFAAMNGGLKATMRSRDVVIASGLAQEGAELVKNVKDNKALVGIGPTSWLPTGTGPWNDCIIDYSDVILTDPNANNRISCGGSTGFVLTPSGSTGLYSYAASAGRFSRKILLSYDASSRTVDCVSAVYWGGNAGPTSIADARSNCILSKSCVYTEAKLAPWE